MAGEIRRLGKETLVYGLSTILGRFLNFLLLPFYTHFLSPAEFGIVATVFAYLGALNVLYQYGMDQAFLRFGTDPGSGELTGTFSTAMTSVLASSACFSFLLFALWRPVGWAGQLGSHADLVKICAGILALDALATVPFAELRRAHHPWQYVLAKTANIAVNAALNVWFLWHERSGLRGIFMASFIASATSLLLLAPVYLRLWRPRFDWKLYPGLLAFALPYIPSGMASWAVQVIDRPILLRMTNARTVGIYSANYRLGIFMMLVINMFDAAWRPFFLDHAAQPDAPRLFARVTSYFLFISMFIVMAISLFIADLVRIPIFGKPLIHPAYWSGLPVVPVVLIGYLFNGLYYNFMPQVYLTKRTDLLIWVTALGAAVDIGVNFAAIPIWGMMAAAWATLLAYLAMAAALYWLGKSLYPIPYQWGKFAVTTCSIAAAWGAAAGVHAAFPQLSFAAWTLVRVAALGAYLCCLRAMGLFDPEDCEPFFAARTRVHRT